LQTSIAKTFAPSITDKHNRAAILSELTFSSSKSEVNEALDGASVVN
jgi:hypothetical protein